MTPSTQPPEAAANAPPRRDVDPALLSLIGSASAPARVPPLPRPPPSMPGTTGRISNLVNFIQALRRGLEHLLEYRAEKGDIYQTVTVGTPAVTLWDADEIQRILKNDEQIWSAAMAYNALMFGGLDPRGGNAEMLLTLDFEDHKAARRILQPGFTTSALEGYLCTADRIIAETVGEWVKRGRVDVKSESRTLLARVAGEVFAGLKSEGDLAKLDRALADFWNVMVAMSKNPLFSPTYRRARKGLATLIEMFTALVPERRQSGGDDLFSRLCTKENLEDEAIARALVMVLFGAFDTTSAALTSMAYFLAKHPAWQDRLRDEALAAGETSLDIARMRAMKQHEWAWKETLRLIPVVMYVGRIPLRDVEVGGYPIAAGTLIALMTGGIGRHPKWWSKPESFDPERFSPERAEDRKHPAIYNPFGAGAHACVGMQVANTQMKQIWHRMLRACRFRLEPDYEGHHTFAPFGIVSGNVRLALEPL